jgi:TolA-binding protein
MKKSLFIFCSLLMLGGCGRKSERELEHDARAAEQQRNFAIAVEHYGEIVDRFQETALAESSQYRIAVLYSNDLRDMRNAARAYRRFHELYPKSVNAPVALFMAAYIFNNELKDIDSSRALYQTFVDQYPGHELAASAKYELANLGKDPGELIHPEPLAEEAKPGTKGGPKSK